MNFRIIVLDNFKRESKSLIKKYPSLKSELQTLQDQLLLNPKMGVMLTENLYKIRLSVKSKGKGKSGGLRVITYVLVIEEFYANQDSNDVNTIYLASIYDKSEEENISQKDILKIIKEIQNL